jgi:hypothetical protein
MSFAQTTKREEADYVEALYEQNKTARYLLAGNRVGILQGTPQATTVLTVRQISAGTYQSPDLYEFLPLSGPNSAVRSAILLGGPFAALSLPITQTVLFNIPIQTNQGFNIDTITGRVSQTFEAGRTYLAELFCALQCNVGDPSFEVQFQLLYFDAQTSQATILGSQNIIRAGGTVNFSRAITIGGAVVGTNPNSYFYATWQTVNSAVPASGIILNTCRIQITAR